MDSGRLVIIIVSPRHFLGFPPWVAALCRVAIRRGASWWLATNVAAMHFGGHFFPNEFREQSFCVGERFCRDAVSRAAVARSLLSLFRCI